MRAPRAPKLLENDARLSALERWQIHEQNIAICDVYAVAYRAYIDAFVKRVQAARDLQELRVLGMPQPVELPRHEPGIDLDGDDALLWDFVERVDRPDDRRALCALHSRSFALRLVLEAHGRSEHEGRAL